MRRATVQRPWCDVCSAARPGGAAADADGAGSAAAQVDLCADSDSDADYDGSAAAPVDLTQSAAQLEEEAIRLRCASLEAVSVNDATMRG